MYFINNEETDFFKKSNTSTTKEPTLKSQQKKKKITKTIYIRENGKTNYKEIKIISINIEGNLEDRVSTIKEKIIKKIKNIEKNKVKIIYFIILF